MTVITQKWEESRWFAGIILQKDTVDSRLGVTVNTELTKEQEPVCSIYTHKIRCLFSALPPPESQRLRWAAGYVLKALTHWKEVAEPDSQQLCPPQPCSAPSPPPSHTPADARTPQRAWGRPAGFPLMLAALSKAKQ